MRVEIDLAHSLSLWVSASITMVMFIEVHHLKSVELRRDFIDLLLLAWLLVLNTWSVPILYQTLSSTRSILYSPLDVGSWSWRILSISLSSTTGWLSGVWVM